MQVVTRTEIADLIGGAFRAGGTDRATLLSTAADNGADPRILHALEELPNERFPTMRDLWDHLPEIPID